MKARADIVNMSTRRATHPSVVEARRESDRQLAETTEENGPYSEDYLC